MIAYGIVYTAVWKRSSFPTGAVARFSSPPRSLPACRDTCKHITSFTQGSAPCGLRPLSDIIGCTPANERTGCALL
ncbi:hypothetical protein E2C01_088794 [Portunus trituberculatus]|uniref:Uncharacterized protein n=1 Tax=Portunus trituberculatus TaxID=210409 RepID=A0A5B7JKJ2_PORTR|nr:hypothetical protein [Portunus trituberculatus]